MTPETRAKISAAAKAVWTSERRAALSEKMREFNRPRSAQVKARIELARSLAAEGLSARQAAERIFELTHERTTKSALIGLSHRNGFKFAAPIRPRRSPKPKVAKVKPPIVAKVMRPRGQDSRYAMKLVSLIEPLRTAPFASLPGSQPRVLWELEAGQCRFPIDGEQGGHALFCAEPIAHAIEVGERQKNTCPHYCAAHVGLAWRGVPHKAAVQA